MIRRRREDERAIGLKDDRTKDERTGGEKMKDKR